MVCIFGDGNLKRGCVGVMNAYGNGTAAPLGCVAASIWLCLGAPPFGEMGKKFAKITEIAL